MCGRFDVENVCRYLVFVVFAKKEQTANLNFLVLSAALKIYLQMSVTALRRPTADGVVWSAIICHSVDAMDTRIWRTPQRWDVGLVPPPRTSTPDVTLTLQEAQLSPRDRAMRRVN